MAEYEEFQEFEEVQEPEQKQPAPEWVKNLRTERDELASKVTDFERREAIRKAELDLNDDQTELLVNAHKGEFKPDALKETAQKLGWVKEPESEQPEVTPKEQTFYENATQAAQGGQPVATSNVVDEIKGANSEQELREILRQRNIPVSDEVEISAPRQ